MIDFDDQLEEAAKLLINAATCYQNDRKQFKLSGSYILDAAFDGQRLAKLYELEIYVPMQFPHAIPDVYETSGIVDSDFSHRFLDGRLCLGVDAELSIYLEGAPTLADFVEGPLKSCLYSEAHFARYKRYPFGERAHGAAGILAFYEELFDVDDQIAALRLLSLLIEGGCRGHQICVCGSGLRIRDCHAVQLMELEKSCSMWAFQSDYRQIMKEQAEMSRRKATLQMVRENAFCAVFKGEPR